ncbi:uncharacterized protein LOC133825101 [Humulus lupulus]|uniref:uncharacterized protein LOC133825101 n=1 Tax=Humulus lupulus TaxID=3486 RepID=UPI002B417099|nr:uncharacterized protein LOC133825101 [Humulus lupulus]
MDPDFEIFDSSSSKEEEEEEIILALAIEEECLGNERGSTSHRSSIPRHAFIRRNSLKGHQRLFKDYFSKSPTYPLNLFRMRFQMQHHLFLHIQAEVEAYEPYFVQRRDAAKRLDHSSLQKITAAMRILTYGVSRDFVDEYLRIAKNTTTECLKKFIKAIIGIFSHEYLRSPNENDIARLCAVGDSRGFPRMLGSIDYMHWKWKNCPSAWKGIELAEGHAPKVNYSINGNDYSMGYYLADGLSFAMQAYSFLISPFSAFDLFLSPFISITKSVRLEELTSCLYHFFAAFFPIGLSKFTSKDGDAISSSMNSSAQPS